MVRRSTAGIAASAGIAVLMVFTFLPAANAVPLVPGTGASEASWAYGTVRSVTFGPLYTLQGWEYEGSATIGFSVIINQTNDTAGPSTFGLSVSRTEGVAISIEFCRPACVAPAEYANLTMHAWERSNAWANFTTQGSVDENGTAVPAIALLNVNSTVAANLTETTFSALRASPVSPVVDRSKYLSAAVAGSATVDFSPALGLIPLNLLDLNPSDANWTASASYAASGRVQSTYYWAFHGPLVGNLSAGPTTVVGTFSPSGNVSLAGSYASPASVDFASFGDVPAVRLAVTGPFLLQDGIVLVPAIADLFGGPSHPWTPNQASGAVTALSTVNFAPRLSGHVGLVAASRSYSLSSLNPANVTGPSTNSTSLATAITDATNPVESGTLQGEPMAVDSAQENSQCLVTGTDCSTTSPAGHGIFGLAFAAVVVVVASALIAAVVLVDRRRLPPPTYPNAALYPPGAANRTAPGTRARPGDVSEPPAEDDPLNHLW